ncbi:MAG: DUF305 domain-containing protein [Chitinophagaceae bacterium]
MKCNHKICVAALFFAVSITACTNQTTTVTNNDSLPAAPENNTASSREASMMESINAMLNNMKNTTLVNDFDHDYATLIITHDQAAVELSEMELAKGTDTAMKAIAQTMVADHKAEIEVLKSFLMHHDDKAADAGIDATKHTHPNGIHTELADDLMAMAEKFNAVKATNNADMDYASLMVIQHEMGIKMAKDHLTHGHHADLRKISQKAVDEDMAEVGKFRTWLAGKK